MHASVSSDALNIEALSKASKLTVGESLSVAGLSAPGAESLRCLSDLYHAHHINAWIHRKSIEDPTITALEVSGVTPSGRRLLEEALS